MNEWGKGGFCASRRKEGEENAFTKEDKKLDEHEKQYDYYYHYYYYHFYYLGFILEVFRSLKCNVMNKTNCSNQQHLMRNPLRVREVMKMSNLLSLI